MAKVDKISGKNKFRPSPDLLTLKNADGSILAIHGANQKYFFRMSSVSTEVFSLLCEKKSVEFIVKKIKKNFDDVSEKVILNDIQNLVQNLLKNKLLVKEN